MSSRSWIICTALMCLAGSHAAWSANSDRMLVAQDGATCALDFENPDPCDTPSRGWAALYDWHYVGKLPARVPSLQVALVSGGVVKSRGETPPERLAPGEYWIVLRFDEWLDEHAAPGQRLGVTPAAPFTPQAHRHPIALVDKPITEIGQLAIYTPQMGRTTPATIFRRELVVSGGRVIEVGGGHCTIPRDGFVISGVGMPALWLSHRGMVGARAFCDATNVTLALDAEAWFRNAQYHLDRIPPRLATADAKARLTGLRQALAKARAQAGADPAGSWRAVRKVLAGAKQLLFATTASPVGEVRGVWMAGVMAGPPLTTVIERFETAGINTAVVLTSEADRTSGAANAMFGELRAHGIRPFLWSWLPCQPMESFSAALAAHPDWADRSATGPLLTPDPACPEAMAWHCDAAERACRELDIDGIACDYEGYDGGYSERSRQAFIARERLDPSFDPAKLDRSNAADPLVHRWADWRRELIVRATHQLAQAARRGKAGLTVVGCVTAPRYRGDGEAMFMIWPDWVERRTFDAITTMAYAQDARWVAESCREASRLIAGRVPFWPTLILYPETGGSVPIEPELLIDQVEGARRAGARGVLLFMGAQFGAGQGPRGDDLYECLRRGLFRSSVRAAQRR